MVNVNRHILIFLYLCSKFDKEEKPPVGFGHKPVEGTKAAAEISCWTTTARIVIKKKRDECGKKLPMMDMR